MVRNLGLVLLLAGLAWLPRPERHLATAPLDLNTLSIAVRQRDSCGVAAREGQYVNGSGRLDCGKLLQYMRKYRYLEAAMMLID